MDCAFEETVSGQLNKVIYDGSTWWMVEEHEYSLRFEDCFFKKADRLTPFSRFTILELAQQVIELIGSRSKIVYLPLPSDDPLMRRPDIGLAKEKLDWQPTIALEEGLKKTIAYFESTL